AAVSSFGFGGNNAHLLVEEWDPATGRRRVFGVGGAGAATVSAGALPTEIAIVALGVVAAGALGRASFTEALLAGRSMLTDGPGGPAGIAPAARLVIDGLRFP